MSELNVYHHELRHNEYDEFYLKYEADKVIEEKDEIIDELKEHIDELQKATDSAWSKVNAIYDELSHQKYKRCLAMAMWCKEKSVSPFFLGEKDLWRFTSNYWMRWQQRWLVLAEKFKEVK